MPANTFRTSATTFALRGTADQPVSGRPYTLSDYVRAKHSAHWMSSARVSASVASAEIRRDVVRAR